MGVARTLNVNLFPPILHIGGLPAALAWLGKQMQNRHGVVVNVNADPAANPTTRDVRILLFEAVRELLFNAVKHARVHRVSLELVLDRDQLCLTVTDAGVGFEPASLDDRWKTGQVGWGLFSIRERLTLLGGRCDVASAPGRGTQVRLRAPRATSRRSLAAPP